MTFEQRRNRLTTHFSERIPVKQRVSVPTQEESESIAIRGYSSLKKEEERREWRTATSGREAATASSGQQKLANPQTTANRERRRERRGCACSKSKERKKITKQTPRKYDEF
jgi:hypothetical protein